MHAYVTARVVTFLPAMALAARLGVTPLRRCCWRSQEAALWWRAGVEDTAAKKAAEEKSKNKVRQVAERMRLAQQYLQHKCVPQDLRGRSQFVRTEGDLANVVEQRILESMGEGEFENLPGKGKPLNLDHHSHGDPDEEVLNRVLAKNGFAPRWVELHKEIRFQMHKWRLTLRFAMKKRAESEGRWNERLKSLETELKDINRQVLDYNLMAPYGQQTFSYNFRREVDNVAKEHLAPAEVKEDEVLLVRGHL